MHGGEQGKLGMPAEDDTLSQEHSRSGEESRGPSPQEIEELGHAAATALADPTWKAAFQMTLNQIIASWLQSDVSETKLRESLWHRAKNLTALEDVLMGAINQLQTQNLSEAEKAEQELNRFDDMQGFGLEDLPGFMDGPEGPLQ